MVDDLRYKRLTNAKALALAGDYSGAYEVLDALHRQYPRDVEVHRLHGNILELDAFASEVTNPMDERLRSARKHYAFILRTNGHDRQAMFDLAEHFSNMNKMRFARCFYEKILVRYGNEEFEEVERAREWVAENPKEA